MRVPGTIVGPLRRRGCSISSQPRVMHRRTRLSVGVLCALLGTGCGDGEAPVPTPSSQQQRPLPLVSDDWAILKMATAHGAFTIEVDVSPRVDTARLSRLLVEPLQENYAEILVYFYDRSVDTDLPMLRVQWTAAEGYAEIQY